MRKYFYSLVENERVGQKRFHLYINASKRFSLGEMLAKQLWVMMHIENLPFNDYSISSGAAREATTHIVVVQKPRSSAFREGRVRVNKETKTVEVYFNHVLEFVFHDKEHINPFLVLVRGKWKGDWAEVKEENHGDN